MPLAPALVIVFIVILPKPARAQPVLDGPVCVAPVVDESGHDDLEIDRALKAAAPLVVTTPRNWQFVGDPSECAGQPRVRFRGHRQPEVRYVVEVQLPGQPTASLAVESHAEMGAFAIAEALCVNALLLLGQPIRPSPPPPMDRAFQVWVAPTSTVGAQVAVGGSELGLLWLPTDAFWLAASFGFETFGHGATATGKYQYSVVQAALLGGWSWQPWERVGIAAGLGVRDRTWLSHLQTTALHEDYDVGIAIESEIRVTIRLARSLRLGLATRPSYSLGEIVVAAPGEPELLRAPHFLTQFAIQIGVEL